MIDDYEEDYEAQELRQQVAHDRKRARALAAHSNPNDPDHPHDDDDQGDD